MEVMKLRGVGQVLTSSSHHVITEGRKADRITPVPRLEVKNVVMEFPAVRALDNVSVGFDPGEVHGIVGENGAGKSTLMKILSGIQRPTSGTVLLDGNPIHLDNVRQALSHGIAMIHQELNLVDELTVAENVYLGREITRAGTLDQKRMAEETKRYLELVHAQFAPTVKVGDLSIAAKQLVEIAKAVSVEASILIMDEPTAVLSGPEAESLFALIAKLRAKGTTILYCSHRLAEVCAICDRITILRDGALISTIEADGANPAHLAGLMVGRPLADFYPPKVSAPHATPILEVRDVHVPGHVSGVGFSVRPGEILGLAGLVGAGRTELAEAIVGARPRQAGEVIVAGVPQPIGSTKDAMKHGIAYVSEDRKGLGLLLSLSVAHNLTLANLKAYGKTVLNNKKERESVLEWKKRLDIRVGDIDAPALHVSGGNQQKVAIAKWLETKPKVIILDEPTRGVDVGAKREMYDLIQKLAGEGLACVVISSELPEIIGLCHRVIVMREGRFMGELCESEMSEEAIMRLAAGVEAA
jgi:ribose transport system ATP-binding protein